ncbi:glycoside hydrolase family 125 protein [Nemorincola caseinilytica]|uniref:Glycoside hydrolase family 125 protein n=1 Tax=Nemorincola caseinilytica TaxID=2054315 RepID=A0ABP8N3A2_9BACT
MDRRRFITQASLAGAAIALAPYTRAWGSGSTKFPEVRISLKKRNFTSPAVEEVIGEIQARIGNKELAWMFGNCFPNTLDTTVDHSMVNGRPDTYVITGDIDAMWLRDSSAQVWPYLPLCKKDPQLKLLIAGVVNRHTKCILKDPYANAFYKNENKVSEWKNDLTDMQPGIHERKWEIDSLCYPIRLAHGYYKETGDTTVLDDAWLEAMKLVIKTFKEQQRKEGKGPYHFMRRTEWATDSLPLAGYGYPVKANGMICSMFRPSDDATVYPHFVPANFFAVESLRQMEEMLNAMGHKTVAAEAAALRKEVWEALKENATVHHKEYGDIYAYEVNGYGSYNLMDDANVPSLLGLGYLMPGMAKDKVYLNTRKFVLSFDNPFYYMGRAGEGIGGPHVGVDHIWPMSIAIRGITATNEHEITKCLKMLQGCHGGTGFMHEAFHKDDATKYTRAWFAWANTLFGEFVWKVYRERPDLLV